MAWDKGFNFRATSGFVADGTNETYSLNGAYPETRNGVTFGWESGPFDQTDRNAALDRRLAGINYQTNDGTEAVFRVDLPAADDYSISLAIGDTVAQGYQYAQVRDNTTPVLTVDVAGGTASNHWTDASTTDWTNATWPTGNIAVTVSFASTTLRLAIGSPTAQLDSTTLAHLFVSQVADVSNAPVRSRKLATQQRMVA